MGTQQTGSVGANLRTAQVQATQTATRVTPGAPSFQEVMGTSADVLMRGAVGAIRALPAGPIVAAAVRPAAVGRGPSVGMGAEGAGAAGLGGGGGAAAGVEAALASSQDMNLYFIELQERLAAENRAFTTYSNVLKARHDTVKNAISNIR
jgi:hypothetical protein